MNFELAPPKKPDILIRLSQSEAREVIRLIGLIESDAGASYPLIYSFKKGIEVLL